MGMRLWDACSQGKFKSDHIDTTSGNTMYEESDVKQNILHY